MGIEEKLSDTLKMDRKSIRTDIRPSLDEDKSPGNEAEKIHIPIWVFVIVSFTLIAVFQWLPFGWNIGPRNDGWTLWSDVDNGYTPFITITSDLITRPFYFWIWIITHKLDSENFVLLNIDLMILVIIRGTALYVLLRRLFPGQILFAYLSGALLMVFPADSGTYFLGATHVLLSYTLQLVALNLLIWYWRDKKWWQLVLALLVEAISIGNYEIGDLLYFAFPLILWWLDRRITRRLLLVSLLWWVFPVISFSAANADLFFNPASHHSTLLDRSGVSYATKLQNVLQAQYWTHYQQGFSQIAQTLTGNHGRLNLATALAITFIVTASALWLRHHFSRTDNALMPNTIRQWLLLSGAGFLAMLLGVIMFFPSEDLNSFAVWQPNRLFYFSAPGATISLTALVFALERAIMMLGEKLARQFQTASRLRMPQFGPFLRINTNISHVLASTILIFVITCSAMSLLTQHQSWRDYSWRQQYLIGEIVRQTRSIHAGTLVFVIDRSNGALMDYDPLNYAFEAALQLVTDNYAINGRLCYNNATDPADTYYCHFLSDGVHIPDIWADGLTFIFPYDRVIGFMLNADSSVTLLDKFPPEFGQAQGYNPHTRFDITAGLPSRYFTMLTYPR